MEAINQETPHINIFTDTLQIDITHWRLEDKDFQAERKAKWPDIEAILDFRSKPKKGINIIKKYYLKGETPRWRKIFAETDGETTYLDIATFLWLHPSSDPAVLRPLRDAYYQGFGRTAGDIWNGMSFLLGWGVYNPTCNGDDWPDNPAIALEGKGKLLFDLIFETVKDGKFKFGRRDESFNYFWRGEFCISLLSDWLIHKTASHHAQYMLLQYDEPLYFTLDNISKIDFSYELKFSKKEYEKWLYRIAFFDTEKEGDTPRTISVIKFRKLLDDEIIPAELASLWSQVKSGEITVKNPWKR